MNAEYSKTPPHLPYFTEGNTECFGLTGYLFTLAKLMFFLKYFTL